MNTILWISQGVLAIMMLIPGFLKLTNSNPELIEKGKGRMDWAEDVSPSFMKIIGTLEVSAAFGLVLPLLLNIMPMLTPLAAIGVILTMLGAISLHIKRSDEIQSLVVNIFILLIAAFVAYGRFVILPA
jgi:multisubunit Na+/H+ antiporter MnhG subunit